MPSKSIHTSSSMVTLPILILRSTINTLFVCAPDIDPGTPGGKNITIHSSDLVIIEKSLLI